MAIRFLAHFPAFCSLSLSLSCTLSPEGEKEETFPARDIAWHETPARLPGDRPNRVGATSRRRSSRRRLKAGFCLPRLTSSEISLSTEREREEGRDFSDLYVFGDLWVD